MASDERPLLRGYLHAGAAVAAALGGRYLVVRSSGDLPEQLSMLVYGIGLTWLFALSALYHVRTWSPRWRAILRRVDHANIFVLIAASDTPIAVNVLSGWWRIGILGAVWTVALVGVSAAAADLQLPRWARAGLYVGMGWIAVVAIGPLADALPRPAMALLLGGGILYSLGAVLYARKWPTLWPRVFGYHEAFHLMTIAAAASIYIVVLVYVLGAGSP